MTEQLVRVTFPGVEGRPLVTAKRAALMVERGWSVVTDEAETPDPTDKPVDPSGEPLPPTSDDNPSPEKPDSRAESHTNKEK